MTHDVEGTGQQVKVKGQIMYFLVNASPQKPLDVATSLYNILCDPDPMVKVRSNNIFSCKCISSLKLHSL